MERKIKINIKRVIYILLIASLLSLALFLSYNTIFSNVTYENFILSTFRLNGLWYLVFLLIIFSFIRSIFYSSLLWYTIKKTLSFNKLSFVSFIILGMQLTFIQIITPFATGSQPYSIAYLKRKGFKISEILPITIFVDLVYQIVLVLLPLLLSPYAFAISNLNWTDKDHVMFIIFLIIGLSLDLAIGLFLLFSGVSTRFQRFSVKIIYFFYVKILRKKDGDKKKEELEKKQVSFRLLCIKCIKNYKIFLVNLTIAFIGLFSVSILYYISCIIGSSNLVKLDFFQVVGLSSASFSANGMIPLPGGLGSQEWLFSIASEDFFNKKEYISLSILVWRFWTSFIPGSIGLLILLIDIWFLIFKNKKWNNDML